MLTLLTNLANKVKEISTKLGLINDYVVEETISSTNGWSYRKWNSGFAEIWYTRYDDSYTKTPTGTVNSWYYANDYWTLPITLTFLTNAHATVRWGTGLSWAVPYAFSNNHLTYYMLSNQNGGAVSRINMYIAGRWK